METLPLLIDDLNYNLPFSVNKKISSGKKMGRENLIDDADGLYGNHDSAYQMIYLF